MKKLKVNLMVVISTVLLGACMSTGAIGSGERWQEEVLLHDGRKVVAERYVQRGGRHEIGQKGAYVEQTLAFKLPDSNQTVEWKDSLSPDLGTASFLPMLLDIAQGVPYLVAYPMGCLSYNKWGRPNPPYVVFRYDAKTWQRIPLDSLPQELKTPNLIFSDPDTTVEQMGKRVVSAEAIQRIVAGTKQAEFKSIIRQVVKVGNGITGCEELIRYKCGWGSPGELNRKYFENSCK